MKTAQQLVRKIALVGPESTGKSSLAQQLAAHFHGQWVPEYARTYLETLERPYVEADLWAIAQGQLAAEATAMKSKPAWLFCDTNVLVVQIWSQDKFGRMDARLSDAWKPETYDFHLLLYPDLTWEPDPLREDPHRLQDLFDTYQQALTDAEVPYGIVKGKGKARLQAAVSHLQNHGTI